MPQDRDPMQDEPMRDTNEDEPVGRGDEADEEDDDFVDVEDDEAEDTDEEELE